MDHEYRPSEAEATISYCDSCAIHEDLLTCAGVENGPPCQRKLCVLNPFGDDTRPRCVQLRPVLNQSFTRKEFEREVKNWQCPVCYSLSEDESLQYPHEIKRVGYRFPAQILNSCNHASGNCRRLRLITIDEPHYRSEAQAFMEHMIGHFSALFWSFECLHIDATDPVEPQGLNRTEHGFLQYYECMVVIALFLKPGQPGDDTTFKLNVPRHSSNDIQNILEFCVPAGVRSLISKCYGWHVIWPVNVFNYVTHANNYIRIQRLATTHNMVKSLVFPMSQLGDHGWRTGYFTIIASVALQQILFSGRNPVEIWRNAWVINPVSPRKYDLVVVRRGEQTVTLLHAPFKTRPLGVRLLDIELHRIKEESCVSPFEPGEEQDPAFLKPRWILTYVPLTKHKNAKAWRNLVRDNEVRSFKCGRQDIWVHCSFCGTGMRCTLEERSRIVKESGEFIIEQKWPTLSE